MILFCHLPMISAYSHRDGKQRMTGCGLVMIAEKKQRKVRTWEQKERISLIVIKQWRKMRGYEEKCVSLHSLFKTKH